MQSIEVGWERGRCFTVGLLRLPGHLITTLINTLELVGPESLPCNVELQL